MSYEQHLKDTHPLRERLGKEVEIYQHVGKLKPGRYRVVRCFYVDNEIPVFKVEGSGEIIPISALAPPELPARIEGTIGRPHSWGKRDRKTS